MNIFYLDNDIDKSVQYLHDVHVRKMCLESVQILCTALNELGHKTPYKSFNPKHPCCLWAMKVGNWIYLHGYTDVLLQEFEYRFEKKHKCQELLSREFHHEFVYSLLGTDVEKTTRSIKDSSMTYVKQVFYDKLPQCMPDKYKQNDTVQAYRNYYVGEKLTDKNGKFIAHYTKREAPQFIKESENYKLLMEKSYDKIKLMCKDSENKGNINDRFF